MRGENVMRHAVFRLSFLIRLATLAALLVAGIRLHRFRFVRSLLRMLCFWIARLLGGSCILRIRLKRSFWFGGRR